MRQFSTYIEYILMTRHYAFVPGIGGFLLRDIDASYSNNCYTPSHKEIHFNRFVTKDDGMLANAYMEADNISYEEACSQIQLEVAKIKVALDKKKSFELGNLGTLVYDADLHLTIKQPKRYPLDPTCYGLSNVNILPWQEVENKVTRKHRGIDYNEDVIAIPTYWLRRAAVIVILFACILFNESYDQTTKLSDFASVINTDILFGSATKKTQESKEKKTDNAPTELVSTEEISARNISVEDVSAKMGATRIETSPTLKNEETKEGQPFSLKTDESSKGITETNTQKHALTTSGKLYYIIIGSCTSLAEAEKMVKKKAEQGFENVGILEKDNRFRLYLKTFEVRSEGEKYLEEVRTNTPFQKAWLLPVRQESLLSFIIKNKDNDQLPMELSHTHKRTERDQGWINT